MKDAGISSYELLSRQQSAAADAPNEDAAG